MLRETHQHGVSYCPTFPEAPLRLFLERCGQVLTLASKKNPPVGFPKLKVGNGPPRKLADVRKCAYSDRRRTEDDSLPETKRSAACAERPIWASLGPSARAA